MCCFYLENFPSRTEAMSLALDGGGIQEEYSRHFMRVQLLGDTPGSRNVLVY